MNNPQFAAYEARCAVAAQLHAAILPDNKKVLFGALSAAGIAVVTIEFDGSGDSGQMESVTAVGPENEELALPIQAITIKDVDFTAGQVFEASTSIKEYLERLAYDFLETTHSGWEDGDGAYGEFCGIR